MKVVPVEPLHISDKRRRRFKATLRGASKGCAARQNKGTKFSMMPNTCFGKSDPLWFSDILGFNDEKMDPYMDLKKR